VEFVAFMKAGPERWTQVFNKGDIRPQ